MCAIVRLPLAFYTTLFIFSREDIVRNGTGELIDFPTGIFVLQIIANFFYWTPLLFLVLALYNRLYQLTGHTEDVATRIIGGLKIAALIITWPIMEKRSDLFAVEKTQMTLLVFYESLQGITLVSMQVVCFYCLFRIARTIDHIVPSGVSNVPRLLWLACIISGVFDVGLFVVYAEQSPVGNLIATCVGAWNSAVILKILVLVKVKHRQYSNDALNLKYSNAEMNRQHSNEKLNAEYRNTEDKANNEENGGVRISKSVAWDLDQDEKLDFANISLGHLFEVESEAARNWSVIDLEGGLAAASSTPKEGNLI
jgi:hypothetical protein